MNIRPLKAAFLGAALAGAALSGAFLLLPAPLAAAPAAPSAPAAQASTSTPAASTPAAAPPAAAAPATTRPALQGGDFLAGYDAGLYRVDASGGRAYPLWLEGEVKKIVAAPSGWFFLTSKGILFSADLSSFEQRSGGLPVKTYKRYEGGQRSFLKEAQDLKDLELDPADPERLVACTKDAAYLTRDGGRSWESLGTPVATPGLKAVALAPYPGSAETAVWASHPIKGLFARRLAAGSSWAPASAGLALLQGTTSVEEVADLVVAPASTAGAAVQAAAQAGGGAAPAVGAAVPAGAVAAAGSAPAVWASNSFLSRVYRWDAAAKAFRPAYAEPGDFGVAESLSPLPDGSLRFVAEGAVRRLRAEGGKAEVDAASMGRVEAALRAKPDWQLLSLAWDEGGRPASLSELWLVAFKDRKPYRAKAEGREGLYLPTGFMVRPETRAKYFGLMAERGLDSVVIDMKDDFGRLRFEPRDPLLRKMGKSSSPLDIEGYVAEAKAKGVYLVARIVVFKDEVIYRYGGGKFAAWDKSANAPWQGYNLVKAPAAPAAPAAPSGAPSPYGPSKAAATGTPAAPAAPAAPAYVREPIKEFWVDPYSEEVWAYNVAIANEIIARGFDEVQFDYIRFPTDGENIDEASFRWRDPGMDKESALASFLRFARENIAAPISIDIYGANGWYRSGVRTGQDVELLAKYVDVVCPMFYPSHFEQSFLAEPPAEERPYRIYKVGTLRNAAIARKRVVVRPYVQAFFLNVSYDRAHYDLEYVRRQALGVRDSANLGMTFWNNSGRYDDVPYLEFGPDGRLSGARAPAAPAATSPAKPAASGGAAQAQAAQAAKPQAQPSAAASAAAPQTGLLD